LEIIKREDIDAIYSTSPPVVTHLISHFLKKNTGLPWVADFRDGWTLHQDYWAATGMHREFEENVEEKIMMSADELIFASEGDQEEFQQKYPVLDKRKTHYIPNGYDPDDFIARKRSVKTKMIFSHVGTVNSTYPLDFLNAFEELTDEIPTFKDEVGIVFCGRIHAKKRRELENSRLSQIIEVKDYLSHNEAVQLMIDSDVLLFFFSRDDRYRKVYTLKLFEYIAAKRFILAMLPSNTLAGGLIERTNTGTVFAPDDLSGIKKEVHALYRKYKKDGKVELSPNNDVIDRFDARLGSERLAEVLNGLIDGDSS
jgi:glycosyltransferase involved in cell wall biosynthesis